jgi:hypothetical protein
MSIEGGRKEETDPAIARVFSPYLGCLEDEATVRLFVGQPSRCLLAAAPMPFSAASERVQGFHNQYRFRSPFKPAGVLGL